jgi:hypothetical protein
MGMQRQPQGNQNDHKRMPGQDQKRMPGHGNNPPENSSTRSKDDDMRNDQKGSNKPSRKQDQEENE